MTKELLVQSDLKRREILKMMALGLGGALTLAQASIVIAQDDKKKGNLNNNEKALLREISELIIPRTDTPGAIDAMVPDYIELYISVFYSKARQKQFSSSLNKIDSIAKDKYKNSFLKCKDNQRFEILLDLDKKSNPFFSSLKKMVTHAYYTSQLGATKELIYQFVPGGYKGCVPFKDIGRTWAI